MEGLGEGTEGPQVWPGTQQVCPVEAGSTAKPGGTMEAVQKGAEGWPGTETERGGGCEKGGDDKNKPESHCFLSTCHVPSMALRASQPSVGVLTSVFKVGGL